MIAPSGTACVDAALTEAAAGEVELDAVLVVMEDAAAFESAGELEAGSDFGVTRK